MLQELNQPTLGILDLLLYVAHLLLIGFNLLGWIWKRTLRGHLLCVVLTALSWFLLGIWYGLGYCFLTDLQWEVKRELGQKDLPYSFIDHFVNQLLRLGIDSGVIDVLTGGIFICVAIISVFRNVKEWKKA